MNSELYTFFLESKTSLPFLYYSIVFLFAASFATFLNVLLFRMPIITNNSFTESALLFLDSKGIDISDKLKLEDAQYNTLGGRSFCPSCRTQIPMWFNIPVLGWLMLRGKSHCCKLPIPARYILIELGFSLITILAFYLFDFVDAAFISWFMFLAIAIGHIDLKTQIIPDEYNYMLMWSGFLYSYLSGMVSLEVSVLSAALTYAAFYAIDNIFGFLTGGNGIGLGDIKLYSAISAWIGISMIPYLALYSSLAGIFMFAFSSLRKKNKSVSKEKDGIPFAPAILIAAITVLATNIA